MTVSQARMMRLFARWHRRIALLVALWLVLLAASGVFINHAHDWKLDRAPLPPKLQEWIYGIEPGVGIDCGPSAETVIDCRSVFARLESPQSALLLSGHSIYLLDGSGQLVEKLPGSQMGLGAIQAALLRDSKIYLKDAVKTVRTDESLLSWETLSPDQARELDSLGWQVRPDTGAAVTWERLLLDLHAARFLGPAAMLFSDLMAALILVLALSGIWLYRIKFKNGQNGIN